MDLDERVARLERAARRWRAIAVAGAAMALAAALAGAGEVPGTLRVRELEIVDESGEVRARLIANGSGEAYLAFVAKGQNDYRLKVGMTNKLSGLQVNSMWGGEKVVCGEAADGSTAGVTVNATGYYRSAGLMVTNDEISAGIYDGQAMGVLLSSMRDRQPALAISDRKGKLAHTFP